MYGHSVEIRIEYPSALPPEQLFHGTTPEFAEAIEREGLRSMGRQYVHLSVDRETAETVARRRTPTPILFRILAAEAAREGILFYPGQDQTWLCDSLDRRYMERIS
jgi:putative RNA 2'-phosphotransferase